MSGFAPVAIDYVALAREATSANTARTFLTVGGGVLLLSLLLNEGLQLYKSVRGDTPDYLTPLARVIAFAFLLLSYTAVVSNVVMVITSLGTLDSASGQIERLFADRIAAVNRYFNESTSEMSVLGAVTSFEGIYAGLMRVITHLSFIFTISVVYALKHIQTFTMAVVVNFGPVLIGFASLGTIFSPLLLAWFWALVEVTAWGVTMTILVNTFAEIPISISPGSAPDLWKEIVVNLVYASAMLAVPAITSSLIRSQSLSHVGQRGVTMLAAARAAATVAGLKGAGGAISAAAWGAPKIQAGLTRVGADVRSTAAAATGRSPAASQLLAAGAKAATGLAASKSAAQARHFSIKDKQRRKGD